MNRGIIFSACLILISANALVCLQDTKARQEPNPSSACIQIRQVSPQPLRVDDSGHTMDVVRLVIDAHGRPEDLREGEVLYSIDDWGRQNAIPLGDLKPGMQTLTVPPGVNMATAQELFEVAIVAPDGTQTPPLVLPLNQVGYVPPPEPHKPAKRKRPPQDQGDADQEVATILPGVDPEEAMSIRAFGPTDVGITSFKGSIDFTRSADPNQPPQTLTLHGVNFKDGLAVRLSTMKGGQKIEATASLEQTKVLATLTNADLRANTNPSTLFSSVVVVPPKITYFVNTNFWVHSVHGETQQACK